jgi:uncharacterized repeat protein (TIGR03803 family)
MRIGDWLNSRRWIAAASLLAAATFAPWGVAHAYTYQVIYYFCSLENCQDGATPSSPLVLDTQGNLYGTTKLGGYNMGWFDSGTTFELTPSSGQEWGYVKLRDFCHTPFCQEGAIPSGPLTYAGANRGRLYDGTSPLFGTTLYSAGDCRDQTYACAAGVAYGLKPDGTPTKWSTITMRKFPGYRDPMSGLSMDGLGDLFGIRAERLLELTHPTPGGEWGLAEIYQFCTKPACADGWYPNSAMIFDRAGNLYGTTLYGGGTSGSPATSGGILYELMPPTTQQGKWTQTVLHVFCPSGNCPNGAPDGAYPNAPLLMDGSGNLYGTTESGGSGGPDVSGGGTAFILTPPTVKGKKWTYTVLYNFCSDYVGGSVDGCVDGIGPNGGLVMDADGNLYGTTPLGGLYGSGTVFELSPPAVSGGMWTETVLYNFCAPSATDPSSCPGATYSTNLGFYPTTGLVMDRAGNLYGVTQYGGIDISANDNNGAGVVFELVK